MNWEQKWHWRDSKLLDLVDQEVAVATIQNGRVSISVMEPDKSIIARAPETARQRDALLAALRRIAESEGDGENQQFKLTRFQAAQVARAAIADAEREGA